MKITKKEMVEYLGRRAKITKVNGTFVHVIVVEGMGYALFENGLEAAIRSEKRRKG